MILFMIKRQDPSATSHRYTIPAVYPGPPEPAITEGNIQLISWNEADYVTSSRRISIENISTLKDAVFDAAQNDALCRDINKQFLSEYGIDIFSIYNNPADKYYKIVARIFAYWPHPMIGNVLVSAGIRPQTETSQYTKNWQSFPKQYMTDQTKLSIAYLLTHKTETGLAELNTSGRDQVRVCRDMTELARAVMGEISTYATKKLEKIYALELCSSAKLLSAQRELIRLIIAEKFYQVSLNKGPVLDGPVTIKELFMAQWDHLKKRPLSVTEYIAFYFPQLVNISDNEMQWTAFVYFLDACLGEPCGLSCKEPPAEALPVFNKYKETFEKFPPVIRCAIVINAIKRFEKNYFLRRYSISVPLDFDFSLPHDFALKCETITEASDRGFIPELTITDRKKSLLWNWSREEKHLATMTYRHYLMPLWAGPSGHSAGLIEFYSRHLKRNGILVDGKWVSIISIILPTMFAFWRLYYDKRISAVHTLAETFEAGYSFEVKEGEPLSSVNRSFINTHIQYEGIWISSAELPVYEDPFDTITYYPPHITNTYGIVNSVRIMAQIKKKHYQTLEKLNDTINTLRNALAEHYEVPQWSKPIKKGSPELIEQNYNNAFKGLVIRSFSNLNVQVYAHKLFTTLEYKYARSEQLFHLYKKIAAVTGTYNFAEDFENLPFIIQDTVMPFLGAVTFSDVKDCIFKETELSFSAFIQTDAGFWENIKALIPIRQEEEIFCVVTDRDGSLDFLGKINIDFNYVITDSLSIHMKHIVIASGLNEGSCLPYTLAVSEIANEDLTLEITVMSEAGNGQMYLRGEYENGKLLTLPKLLSLLGVDEVIPVTSILPDEESVFGSLGLRDISVTVSTDPVCISHIDFTITAEKPWNIFDEKITLQPYFEITIDSPFDSTKRRTDYTVLGIWQMGASTLELIYRSDKIINARLAENSVLDFAELVRLFAVDVKFPEIKLTGMEMTADLAGKNYSLFLSAEDVLTFQAGGTEIAVSDIMFALNFTDGSFGDLALNGTLVLGGLSLSLSGAYGASGTFSFEAAAYTEYNYSLGDFIEQTARELSGSFDRESFPKDFLTANIRMAAVSYHSQQHALLAYIEFDNVMKITDEYSIDQFALKISSEKDTPVEFEITAGISICNTFITLSLSKEEGMFTISGTAVFENLTFADIAGDFGIQTDILPEFIAEFAVTKITLSYNLTTKDFSLGCITSAGEIAVGYTKESGWQFYYKTSPESSINMLAMPLAGELVEKVSPGISDFEIKDFEIGAYRNPNHTSIHISNGSGIFFKCTAFGHEYQIDIYKNNKPKQTCLAAAETSSDISGAAVKWIELNKTFAILSISKIGIGLDGSRALLLLDASLQVSPFSFSLMEAGIGVNLSKLSDMAFYLSGFGIAFDNGTLSIAGSFFKSSNSVKTVYAGALLIKCGTLAATAIGEYSAGSFMAYLAVSASIGGPPAFYVTGLSLGFGYNKKLLLPQVEDVPKYPLITAAREGFQPQILEELHHYIQDETGQNFLTAGIKFTSYQLINGFLLLSISFGKQLEIGVLGIADISIPPNVAVNPIAKAQLALKAVYSQAENMFCAEARLTSESYILSHDCRLTGGFAAYFWFSGSEHEGDFVITLGGYHPAYQKPEHYPVVPRLGLNWNINEHLNISGELYFALTPGAVMAGGRLSAVYTQGNLKAWFIAYADFLISWKPFYYQAKIGVSLGASYRVDWWLIHKTFSIELGAELALWGPEIQGRLHVSWFILSFTIAFSKGADHSKDGLDWAGFKESFLYDNASKRTNAADSQAGILTASIEEGIVGQTLDGIDIVDANTLKIAVSSKIPESGHVRPVKSADLKSQITLDVLNSSGSSIKDRFSENAVTKNVPAALWKSAPADLLKEDSVVKDAVCGAALQITDTVKPALFPQSRYISLEELYKKNTLAYTECFAFGTEVRLDLSEDNSIHIFSEHAGSAETIRNRQKFLSEHGITETISIADFAGSADDWLSEDILINRRPL